MDNVAYVDNPPDPFNFFFNRFYLFHASGFVPQQNKSYSVIMYIVRGNWPISNLSTCVVRF
jgi:hypothetical protein